MIFDDELQFENHPMHLEEDSLSDDQLSLVYHECFNEADYWEQESIQRELRESEDAFGE